MLRGPSFPAASLSSRIVRLAEKNQLESTMRRLKCKINENRGEAHWLWC